MTKPLYCLLRELCGLTISEAAAFHRCSHNTATKWSSGGRNAPQGVLDELRMLYRQINVASCEGRLAIDLLPCEGARDKARGLAYLRDIGIFGNGDGSAKSPGRPRRDIG